MSELSTIQAYEETKEYARKLNLKLEPSLETNLWSLSQIVGATNIAVFACLDDVNLFLNGYDICQAIQRGEKPNVF